MPGGKDVCLVTASNSGTFAPGAFQTSAHRRSPRSTVHMAATSHPRLSPTALRILGAASAIDPALERTRATA
jgi:hypothetical protein